MTDCNSELRHEFSDALSQDFRAEEVDGDCRVVLPLYKPDGDPVVLYIIEDGDEYVITDEGYTHGALFNSGVNLDTTKRENRLQAAAERFNLEEAKSEVRARARSGELGSRIWDTAQAAQWIGFLQYTKKPHSPSYFKEKVAAFLKSEGFNVIPDQKVKGESGRIRVDFEVADVPRRTFIETIQARGNTDLKEKSIQVSWKWIKIGRVMGDVRFYSVINDKDVAYGEDDIEPLLDDSTGVISWEDRDLLTEALSA